jgi:hypothetical protein
MLNSQLQSFQLKFTERLENRLSSKPIKVLLSNRKLTGRKRIAFDNNVHIDLKSGYLSFALESTLKKELVIENVRAICWIVPKKYLLLLDQTILLH